ncbi:MAG: TolC family protein [Prevotellaceae bacterium]|jgi:outer membrane protein TolC|nr:TolC family protein [Prevotellaceae bacterium]
MKRKYQTVKIAFCALLFFVGGAIIATSAHAQIVLTMEKAMEIAGKNSPTLRNALMNMERYQQNLIAQRAALKSQFSLSLNPLDFSQTRTYNDYYASWYTTKSIQTSGTFRVDQPILLTDGTLSLVNTFGWQNNTSTGASESENRNKAFSNNLYLSLSQPIFTYNRRKLQLRQIEFDLENANINYALQRLNIERMITQQFYSVYTAQNNLLIRQDELENAQQSYEIIKNKVDADMSAREELYQAEVNLANAQSSMEDQEVQLANSKDVLKQTIGMDLDENIAVEGEVVITPVDINVQQAVDRGLASRLELRQREIETKNLEFTMIQTKAQNEFSGTINLSVGLMGENEQFQHIYRNSVPNPRVQVSFSVPLFDWGANKARVKAQQVAQQINQLEAQNERIDIELNIRQTYRSLENLKRQIKLAEQNVTNAQMTYDLNLVRYREGDITGMDISQFQTQLSSAKMSYSQALINYKIELLNMKILSLYDFEKNTPIVPLADVNNEQAK